MEIFKVFRNNNNEVTHVLTNSGSIIQKDYAVELAKEGYFECIDVIEDSGGEKLFNFVENQTEDNFESIPSPK